MSSFEEAREVIAALWQEDLDRLELAEREHRERYAEAERRVVELKSAVHDGEAEIESLRSEQEASPRLIMLASIREDREAEQELRRRYSETESLVRELTGMVERARRQLHDLTGGNPERYLREARATPREIFYLRARIEEGIPREFADLRETLEERLEQVTGRRRTVEERVRDERYAALRRRAGE